MHEVNYRPDPRGDYLIQAGMTVPDPAPVHFTAFVSVLAQDMDLGDLIPGTVVDGVTVTTGDRVLRFGNTGTHYAGIYVVGTPGNPATRSTDADSLGELVATPLVYVTNGSVYGGIHFEIVTDGDLDVGVTIMPI